MNAEADGIHEVSQQDDAEPEPRQPPDVRPEAGNAGDAGERLDEQLRPKGMEQEETFHLAGILPGPRSAGRHSSRQTMRRVVITGIGVISPIGIGSKSFWDNLLAGKVGVRRIASFDPAGFASQIGGEVPAFKIGDYVPKSYRKATKVMARDIELAVVAADDAFKDAGIQSKAYT